MAIFRVKNTLLREQHGLKTEVGDQRADVGLGSKDFIENIKEKLGIRAKGRKVEGSRDLYHLGESQAAYNSNFTLENSVLSEKNTYFWNVNS